MGLPAILFIVFGGVMDYFRQDTSSLAEVSAALRVRLTEVEKDFYQFSNGGSRLIEDIVQGNYSEQDHELLASKPYTVLVFRNDALVYWSNNSIELSPSNIDLIPTGLSYARLKNAVYQLMKIPYMDRDKSLGKVDVVAFYPLRSEYIIENKYLQRSVKDNLEIPDDVVLLTQKAKDAETVWENTPQRNLYLTVDNSRRKSVDIDFPFFLRLLGLVFFVFLCFYLFNSWANRGRPRWAIFFFGIFLILFRVLVFRFGIPIDFEGLGLFQYVGPETALPLSSGGLLFSLVLALLWVILFTRHFEMQMPERSYTIERFSRFCVVLMIFFMVAFLGVVLIANLVQDVEMSFLFYDLIQGDAKSYAGLACILIIMLIIFLMARKLVSLATKIGLSRVGRFQALFLLFVPVTFIYLFQGLDSRFFFSGFLVFIFVLLIERPRVLIGSPIRFTQLAFWVVIGAFATSIFIHSLNVKRENALQEQLAMQVNTEKDEITEFRFEEISINIVEDDIVKKYFKYPYLSQRELSQRIRKKYFDEYFAKYDIQIYPYFKQGQPIKSIIQPDYGEFEKKILKAPPTKNNYLYLISNPEGNYTYVAKLPIFQENGRLMGFLVMELRQIISQQSNVYPELVIEDKYRSPANFDDYSYAIYSKGLLKNFKGDLAYSNRIDKDFLDAEHQQVVRKGGFRHLIYKTNGEKVVVISKSASEVLNFLSLFSYLFLTLFLFAIFCIAILSFFGFADDVITLKSLFLSSLKKKINAAMVATLFFSFLVIGLVTIAFFSNRSIDYHSERLIRKNKAVLGAFEYTLKEFNNKNGLLSNKEQLEREVNSLSEIHSMDINVYDLDGKLLTSSQPFIFEKGLISENMNSNAYYALHQLGDRQLIQNEEIGSLSYLASYAPIKDDLGNVAAYINVPYFAREKNLRNEISTYLVTLINVYALILLIASLLSVLISNYVTKSLGMISDRLKEIRLGQRNEKLEWHDDDEIGDLVEQYNQTIEELDSSARKLAQSERKIAWESMAKQVAHEIKNPLTPMKLSIQHLQRAQRENHPQVKELTERVSRTLIEQIDHLSQIATEFSDFAKMPETKEVMMDLNHSLQSVVDLYREVDEVTLDFEIPMDQYIVYADKNQMNRLFQNLIKNAMQAIPDGREGKIFAGIRLDDDVVVASVSDNGKGISDEDEDKVFVPSFTTKSSGMGLGLAISKNIIENIDGQIYFESEVNVGTTFYIRLKLHDVIPFEG